MTAAAENLAQRLRDGQTVRVKVYDKAAGVLAPGRKASMADDWAPRAGHAGERCFCAHARAAPIFGAARGAGRDGFQWKSIASGSGCNDQALSLRISSASGGSAADVPPSAATGAAVEPVRALRCTSAFSGPASGVAGDRGDDLAGVQRAKRSAVIGTTVSSSSGRRSRAA